LQDGAPVVGALAALLSDQMVGEISGQTLAPVPPPKVNEHAIAHQLCSQLVRVRRMQDEWKPDDLLAQEREGRHAVAGLPKNLHQGELE